MDPRWLRGLVYHKISHIRHLPFFGFFFFFVFLGLYVQHMEIPRLGVKLELQLPAYATAIGTRDPSGVCDTGPLAMQDS